VIAALNATKAAADRNGGLIAEKTLNKLASGHDVAVSQSCFLPGSLVRTADGRDVAIENVLIGTDVVTHHGNVGQVNATIRKNHTGEVIRFRAVGLPDDVVCTPDHKLWVRPVSRGKTQRCPVCGGAFKSLNAHLWQKKDPQHQAAHADYSRYAENWFVADSLVVGDYVRTPFDTTVNEEGDPVYAELLGYYLAEGCTWEYDRYQRSPRDCYKGVDFIFSCDETVFHERVAELCRQLGYTSIAFCNQKSRPGSTTVRVSSAQLATRLLADGGQYAWGKFVATRFMQWSPAIQMKIAARFVDGDGSWHKTCHRLTGVTVSRQLAFAIATICWRNGIAARINKSVPKRDKVYVGPNGKPMKKRTAYAIEVNRRNASGVGSDKTPHDYTPRLTYERDIGHLKHQVAGRTTTFRAAKLLSYVEAGFVYRKAKR
jgi:hypothetical protein